MRIVSHTKKKALYIMLTIMSLIANISIKIIPFKRLISVLTNCDHKLDSLLDPTEYHRIGLVLTYLKCISNKVPWRVMCFEQALVLLVICRWLKINVNIYFGIKKDEGNEIMAHAWTSIGKHGATGIDNAHEYNVVLQKGYVCDNRI